jgi:tetratricopeptide (TPR) repeat protein
MKVLRSVLEHKSHIYAKALKLTAALAAGSILAACTTGGTGNSGGAQPITGSLYSEFKAYDDAPDNEFGPFVAATLAQQTDQSTRAAAYYIDAFGSAPESRFVADRAFSQLLMSGHLVEATDVAAKLVELSPEEADDLVRLTHALAAFKNGDWPGTRKRLEVQLSSGFGFLLSPLLHAWSFAAEDDVEAVDTALAPLLANEQLRGIGLEHKAFIYDYMGRSDEALELYDILVNAERPTSLQPVVAYASLLFRMGDRAAARSLFTEQAKRYNNHPFLLQHAGLILQGRDAKQVAASPSGAMAIVFGRLANEFFQSKSYRVAVIYHRLAFYLTPDLTEIHYRLGQIFEQLNNPLSAANEYSLIPAKNPLGLAARSRRASALRQSGDLDGATELFKGLLKERPGDRLVLSALGDIAFAQSDFETGIEYYSKIIEAIETPVPNDWPVYYTRSAGYERLGNWEQAEADLLTAFELNPEDPNILNNLGYSWIDRGINIERAKGMIEKAVAARPDDGAFADSLGWAYYLTGDYERAVRQLEKAVRLEPTSATINDHLGDAYWKVGRRIEARFQWRHALEGDADDEERVRIAQKIEAGRLAEREQPQT